ncbi:10357_t:CDS:2 [Funneliformis geosporum]|uniref:10357_t:CDS:1 n=1 Tax=Funneliformis geosporum TaxID=1117311 RepID=A0A9W4SVD1_9GLOM|nr:10357_t:CDS:2 [Funneliformis geosporum]
MILTSNVELNSVPFNFDCDWLKYYVGWNNDKKHELDYEEFTQFELQIKVDTNRCNKKQIRDLKQEIVELKSEISILKSQLYHARKDVRDKGKYISSLEERLYLQNQGIDPADNTGVPVAGRDQAIEYLRDCMTGRTLE